ncbi:MAG: hypothetical protein PHR98_01595 [Candidatus Shapirobacteria bacterium]|nr:hypothetical protein [Candidatus Shapirobacteria bacterium]
MHPKIKFKIDPKKDISTFFDFLKDAKYDEGRNFEWAILKHHPYFKKFNGEIDKKIVKDFVFKYYSKNKKAIEKNIITHENNWKKIEKDFFKLAHDLFLDTKWPKGKYIAYTTMWSMYPRFLDDKTFQIPAISKKKKVASFIIAHEMLHFIFYEYFLNKYKKYKSHKYDFFVWHVSEIFNVIIMNRPEWQKILKNKDDGYPEHGKIIEKLSKKECCIDELVDNIVLEVNKIV